MQGETVATDRRWVVLPFVVTTGCMLRQVRAAAQMRGMRGCRRLEKQGAGASRCFERRSALAGRACGCGGRVFLLCCDAKASYGGGGVAEELQSSGANEDWRRVPPTDRVVVVPAATTKGPPKHILHAAHRASPWLLYTQSACASPPRCRT